MISTVITIVGIVIVSVVMLFFAGVIVMAYKISKRAGEEDARIRAHAAAHPDEYKHVEMTTKQALELFKNGYVKLKEFPHPILSEELYGRKHPEFKKPKAPSEDNLQQARTS
jgi:hypothetical protein